MQPNLLSKRNVDTRMFLITNTKSITILFLDCSQCTSAVTTTTCCGLKLYSTMHRSMDSLVLPGTYFLSTGLTALLTALLNIVLPHKVGFCHREQAYFTFLNQPN